MSEYWYAAEDILKQAKPGKYLVVGTDTFPWPHQDYIINGLIGKVTKASRPIASRSW